MYQTILFDEPGPLYVPKPGALIYQAGGKAGEYALLGCNIYKGCTHGCRYCYNDNGRFENYFQGANPKKDYLRRLEKELGRMDGWEMPEIFLSFVGDVYQPEEIELGLTRRTIELFIRHDLRFTVLTKGGTRAVRDFDLMGNYSGCSFASTIVFMNQKLADYWEPGAALVKDRIAAIEQAKARGIRTWVSLEPVIEPEEALAVIRELHPVVDHWRVGKINHHPELERRHDWKAFGEEVRELLADLNADYYLKRSLREL